MPRTTKVFVSYRNISTSREKAQEISAFLQDKGFDVFWDVSSLRPGYDWADTIYNNIFGADNIESGQPGSDVLIVLLEEETADSDWVQREVDTARGAHVSILPVRLKRGVSIVSAQDKLDMRRQQYLDYEDESFYIKLLDSLDELAAHTRNRQELLMDKLRHKWRDLPIDDTQYTPSYAAFRLRDHDHDCQIHQAHGDITHMHGVDGQPIDAIVNSENDFMQMARVFEKNRVSSLLRYYGSKLHDMGGLVEEDTVQMELDRQVQERVGFRPIALGQVLYTNAGHSDSPLRRERGFRYIIHAATVSARDLENRTPQTARIEHPQALKQCVINCLEAVDDINAQHGVITPTIYGGEAQRAAEEANADAYKPIESIIFPLFATGHTNARLHVAIDAMNRGFIQYLRLHPQTSLKHIYLCVYRQRDITVVHEELSKAFQILE